GRISATPRSREPFFRNSAAKRVCSSKRCLPGRFCLARRRGRRPDHHQNRRKWSRKMNLRASGRETASLAPRISIVYRPIGQLKPDPANPRLHSKKQIRQIAKSIEAFGFNVPILVDADLNVIAGHGRLLAGAELGMSEAPTLRLDHLTPAQARAFMIADNRLS